MQWRKNRVAIGAFALAALLATTLWAVRTRDDDRAETETELPTLELDDGAVTSLEITRPEGDGTETVVLSKVGDHWLVTSPVEAEADQNNVQSALDRLGDMQPTGIAATRPENYPRLEVDDAQAVKVVPRSDDTPLVELRIGKYANGATMVRIDDRPEVFKVDGSVRYTFDRDLKSWRNRRVTEIDASDVREIEFDSNLGTFKFVREGDDWVQEARKRPIKDLDANKVQALVSTAARLTASGFAPSDVSAARAGLTEPDATVTVRFATTPDAPAEAAAETSAEDVVAPTKPTELEVVVLQIGDEAGSSEEFYLRRGDNPTLFVISKYLADRLRPNAEALTKSEAPAPPPLQGMPPQGMPAQEGQPQLPPEVMRQLEEQIRKQQQAR